MKTINLKLSKKLTNALQGMQTQNYINEDWEVFTKKYLDSIPNTNVEPVWKFWIYVLPLDSKELYKTLTLEEAVNFLDKDFIHKENGFTYRLAIWKIQSDKWWIWYTNKFMGDALFKWKIWETRLEAVESMIEYLLNNNLIWNT